MEYYRKYLRLFFLSLKNVDVHVGVDVDMIPVWYDNSNYARNCYVP